MTLDRALHHCASVVVLDVALPARLGQVIVFGEALLAEVLDRVVVRVREEVMELLGLSMVLQLVHEA